MSRLAKKIIPVPQGVTLELSGRKLKIKGAKGEEELNILEGANVKLESGGIKVETEGGSKQNIANAGTTWSLIRSGIEGVSRGYSKVLEIEGVGFRANMESNALVLNLGFTNPIKYTPPPGVNITVQKNEIAISGNNKAKVGEVAAAVRALKKPEPYKGKGIRYRGEVIRRKVGKKAGTVAGV